MNSAIESLPAISLRLDLQQPTGTADVSVAQKVATQPVQLKSSQESSLITGLAGAGLATEHNLISAEHLLQSEKQLLETGLEPARVTPLDPKSSASANSATLA